MLAAIFGVRLAAFTVFAGRRPDTEGLWLAARTYPGDVYRPAAEFIATHHGLLPPPQGPGYLGLPTNILLGLPIRALPEPAFVAAWVVFDAGCLVAALLLLLQLLAPMPRLALAASVAAGAIFPPVFAELQAGQRGGPILLLAVLAMRHARRAGLTGVLVGAAASLKLYPGAMVLGDLRPKMVAAAAAAAGLLLLAAFAPLGGPLFYVQHVLFPALQPSDADCAITSVRSLWMRALGGEAYYWIARDGHLVRVQTPVDLPALAQLLAYATELALVGVALWAARRAGFASPNALAVTFALGAVVPGEVYPYQYLPLLPLVLTAVATGFGERRWLLLGAVAAGIAAFVPTPCSIPFPNLWTLGGLGLFVIGAAAVATSRTSR